MASGQMAIRAAEQDVAAIRDFCKQNGVKPLDLLLSAVAGQLVERPAASAEALRGAELEGRRLEHEALAGEWAKAGAACQRAEAVYSDGALLLAKLRGYEVRDGVLSGPKVKAAISVWRLWELETTSALGRR